MIIFSIIFLILLVIISKKYFGKYINPVNIFVGMNLSSIILMYGTSIIDSNLSNYVWLLIVCMIVAFIIGNFLPQVKITFRGKKFRRNTITDIIKLKKIIILYSIVFDFFAIYYLIHMNRNFGLQNMLENMSSINYDMQFGNFETGIYTYFTPIAVPLSLMILFYFRNVKCSKYIKSILGIQYILCYIPCISPRRDSLFFMLTITFLYFVTQENNKIRWTKNNSRRFKRIFFSILIIVFAVWIMSFTQRIMNKSVANSIEFTLFGIKAPSFLKDPIIYFAGNYPYLERTYQAGRLISTIPFISTLRLFYRYVCPIIGLNLDTTSDFMLKFYNIGSSVNLQFNTVPILYYIIKDLDLFFPLFFIFMGIISKYAFYAVQNNKSIGKIMIGLFQYDIILFSFRSYNVIYLSYILSLLYMFIAYKYVDVELNGGNSK